ncbi:MAG: DEAD/DEAH box helicase [Gammaproteobacteria bacterium]|nr:DEAD/DEAH box helicase [Gammaproteobacteria bacterium]
MAVSDIDLDAPGLAFSKLLRRLKPKKIKLFLPNEMIEILERLDPSFSNSEKIIDLAANLLDPAETLQDNNLRSVLISSMPQIKVRELCVKLGVPVGRNPFEDALRFASEENNFSALLSFFGVVDDPTAPTAQLPGDDTAKVVYGLFAHQRLAAKRTELMLSKAPHRGVLHMPTGAGKTRTAMHLAASHLTNKEPTLVVWLAQNIELLDQAADEFQKSWRFLGNREVGLWRLWGSKHTDLTNARDGLIVAGLAKMVALEKNAVNDLLFLADRASLVIIDEAHQAIAPTYSSVLDALATKRASTKLLGLTATPGRTWTDTARDEELSAFFGGEKVMLEVEGHPDPVTYLIEEGYLSNPRFRTLNVKAGLCLSQEDLEILSSAIDVPRNVLEGLGQCTQRNLKIISECESLVLSHRRVIVFAPSIANARMLATIMVARGTEALVVTGESSPADREQAIRRFKSQAPDPIVMFNYGVLTTGFDAPQISAAVIARPTKSLVLYSQMVGRATRGKKAGGNEFSEIVTVTDTEMQGFGDVAEAFCNWEDIWNEQNEYKQ